MEGKWRWILLTTIAPVAWGANYYAISRFLPDVGPLWGATLRALPAGLLLLALARTLPRGVWWWRAAVLGVLNVGAFFLLIHLAAQLLPSSVAAVIMATSPVGMMLLAWALVSERPVVAQLASAALGIGGVVIMLAGADGAIHLGGVAASLGAMTMSSLGFVLAKRWNSGQQRANALTTSAWQLTAGGLLVLPLAALLEPFPSVTGRTLVGLAWVSGVATALAYVVWFQGLRRLTAGQVGLIGLLNPVAGVVTGTLLAAEVLTLRQAIGIALVLVGVVVGQRTAPAPRPAAGTAPRPTESGRAVALATD